MPNRKNAQQYDYTRRKGVELAPGRSGRRGLGCVRRARYQTGYPGRRAEHLPIPKFLRGCDTGPKHYILPGIEFVFSRSAANDAYI